MASNHEYIDTYLANLPPTLRPTDVNETIKNHLREAWRNKWDARDLAIAVASGNFNDTSNPIGLSVYRLGQVAKQKAFVKKEIPRFVSTPHESIPREWAEQRTELLRAIGRGTYANPEEATKAMQDLIEQQKSTVTE